ncbi:hypothetical protein HpKG127_04580 [Helicobacter pylori]
MTKQHQTVSITHKKNDSKIKEIPKTPPPEKNKSKNIITKNDPKNKAEYSRKNPISQEKSYPWKKYS